MLIASGCCPRFAVTKEAKLQRSDAGRAFPVRYFIGTNCSASSRRLRRGRPCVRCWRRLAPNPLGKIDAYSDSIGAVLDTVEGTEGADTLKPEDLDVWVKIVKVGQDRKLDWQSNPAAWSQPHR